MVSGATSKPIDVNEITKWPLIKELYPGDESDFEISQMI